MSAFALRYKYNIIRIYNSNVTKGKIIRHQSINEEISVSSLIVIDEHGKSLGQLSYDQAMLIACQKELDLVEVSHDSNPPVARLVDFAKKRYEEEKRKRKQKAKQKTPELKEIKLGIKIGQHDLETKVEKAKDFFAKGHKVRIVIQLRGREMMFSNKVIELSDKFIALIDGIYEQHIKRQGKRFSAIIKKKQGNSPTDFIH